MIAIESLSPDLDRGFHCRVLVGSLDEAWTQSLIGAGVLSAISSLL